jgi:hypothetical protein
LPSLRVGYHRTLLPGGLLRIATVLQITGSAFEIEPALCCFGHGFANRDILYSSGVFGFDAGPVTITLSGTCKRFMPLQVISEDHCVPEVV